MSDLTLPVLNKNPGYNNFILFSLLLLILLILLGGFFGVRKLFGARLGYVRQPSTEDLSERELFIRRTPVPDM